MKNITNFIKNNEWVYPVIISFVLIVLLVSQWKDLACFSDGHKTVLTLSAGLIAFTWGLVQYRKSQVWKRNEFIVSEYQNFISNRYVQRVMVLLDYPISNFYVFEEEPTVNTLDKPFEELERSNKILIKCDYKTIAEALSAKYDDEKPRDYMAAPNIIRHSFDKFLFKLGLVNKYIDSNLISRDEIKPFIIYWLDLINSDSSSFVNNQNDFIKMKKQLRRFMKKYRYEQLEKLFEKFDIKINE